LGSHRFAEIRYSFFACTRLRSPLIADPLEHKAVIAAFVIDIPVRVVTPVVATSAQVGTSLYLMPPQGISVVVFLCIYSNFAVGYSTSDLSMVYYLTCRRVFCPFYILKVYITSSKVGLALQILKLACVDDSGSVSDAHVLSGQAVQ
jgi:hypothetical protein